jgi:hypothetical protein
MWRQGDLLIVKVGAIPKDAVKCDNRILAEGEVTNHLHELDSGEVYMEKDTLYFRVGVEKATLVHPEHKPLTFEHGVYRVIRQREYQPQGWRRVSD